MIERCIDWALKNRLLVICATVLLSLIGIRAVYTAPVDVIPDLSDNQVIVVADWEGRSPQEVEDHVTYPLVTQLQGLTGIEDLRASSMFGFSLVTLVFEESMDNYFARDRVLERLNQLGSGLPSGVEPRLGPDANGLGWVYQYYLKVDSTAAPNGGYDLGRLRSVQDWYVRYHLAALPGVAEVAGIGGFEQQYQVEVSSFRLRSVGITLAEVAAAVRDSNLNTGGQVIEENGLELVVRGVGLLNPANMIGDLEGVVVGFTEDRPVYLKEVATVQLGGAFRRGTLDVDGREVVGGIVVMRTGQNAREVTRAIEKKIAAISSGLPAGVSIESFYDRSELIDATIDTLNDALWKEVLLVVLVHVLFLWHFRSVLIVTIPLPLSILGAFGLMKLTGVTSNVMSLGGIAIAIGVLVDAGIVMTENVLRRAESRGTHDWLELVRASCLQVGRPILFAMLIIVVAFLPVFSLSGEEGKLFRPLAFTKTFAMMASLLVAVFLVPVLCSLLARGRIIPEEKHLTMGLLVRGYTGLLDQALRHPALILIGAAGILFGTAVLALGVPGSWQSWLVKNDLTRLAHLSKGVGSEFMPALNEGSLLFMPVMAPGVSLPEVQRVMAWQDRVIRELPEVQSVAGKLGRAETATDPAPIEMIETTILLKPEYVRTNKSILGVPVPWTIRNPEWRAGMTQQRLVAELTEKLSAVPGYVPGFLQPIENRVLMLNTGIRGQVGVKVLGEDLDTLQSVAERIEELVQRIPGATGVAASKTLGQPYLELNVNRQRIAQHGMSVANVMEAVELGIGGREVSTIIDGRERVSLQVRLARGERTDVERLGDILVATPSGTHVPLGMLAEVKRKRGPNVIESENGQLRAYVQMNVRDRDLGGFVAELKRQIRETIEPTLPRGTAIAYSGQFEDQIRARNTLMMIVPASLLLIFMLLLMLYHSALEAAHVLLAVPFALSGGMYLQFVLGYPFSVATWVGYIALFGTAIQTAIVMVVYLNQAVEERREARGDQFDRDDLVAAVKDGARLRLRPKLMTVVTIVASLLPIMIAARPGAEVMKPLAAPIVGGMASSLVHILIVTPVIFVWLHGRELKRR